MKTVIVSSVLSYCIIDTEMKTVIVNEYIQREYKQDELESLEGADNTFNGQCNTL